jgi:hypothetical protein
MYYGGGRRKSKVCWCSGFEEMTSSGLIQG